MQSLNDSGFSVVTDFVILVPDQKSDYILYDVYNHFKLRGGLLNITTLGSWNKEDGLTVILTVPKIIRRRNFHGLRTKAAGIVSSAQSKRAIPREPYFGRVANAKYVLLIPSSVFLIRVYHVQRYFTLNIKRAYLAFDMYPEYDLGVQRMSTECSILFGHLLGFIIYDRHHADDASVGPAPTENGESVGLSREGQTRDHGQLAKIRIHSPFARC